MNLAENIIVWSVYIISLFFAIFWFIIFLSGGITKEPKKKLKSFPNVTIAIPVYNREKSVSLTIDSALALDYHKNKIEILVVNHGSTDKSREVIESYKEKVRILNIKRKPGERKGAPMNAALQVAKGEFFVCLDADSIATRSSLKEMLPYFEDKKVGCVLPSMKVYSPKNFWHKLQRAEYIVNMFYKRLMGHLNCIHVAPGPFSIFRTSILKEVGGYDANNLTEDLEITYKLQKHQYQIVQLLKTEVFTIAPKTFKEIYEQRNRWFKGALINTLKYKKMMFNKKYGDFGFIQLPTVIISAFLAISLILITLYFGLKPHLQYLYDMRFVNFDFLTILKNLSFNFNIFDLNYALVITAIVTFLISVTILIKSHTHNQEKMLKIGLFPLVIFFVYYYIIMGIAWMGVALDFIRGKHQHW
ncbi:glycosyltransferase family 2 protein [Candidatus Woesearchaeota archaeon]|nr:glycosyltransferase family 2 protein [Candidatus Woesearchaeota archaeon]